MQREPGTGATLRMQSASATDRASTDRACRCAACGERIKSGLRAELAGVEVCGPLHAEGYDLAHPRRRDPWVFFAALAVLLFASPVSAQSDETLLLRSCVSERGWRTDVDDCLIVAEVVRERMDREGGAFAENLRALAPRLHNGCRISRTWLCDLDVDCHRPEGWPRSASWERRRPDCEETVREVRAILDGSTVSTCVERPRHWGSRLDVARREAAGLRWRDAVCPGLVLLNRAGFLYRRRS